MAGYDVAVREAERLKAHLESYGIRVSIELQQGRGEWYVQKYHVMNHHTATQKGSNPTPALYICKYGRSDVPGPLCNGYGGYDQVFRIITMGLANHSGAGGPIAIDGVYVPRDSGRGPFFGIEWEGGYHTWTAEERRWMAVVNFALTEFYGRPLTSQLEHKTWAPTRKIDRKDYTRDISIADTQAVRRPSTPTPTVQEDNLMPYTVIHVAGDPSFYRIALTPTGPIQIPDEEYYQVGVGVGMFKNSVGVTHRQYDVANSMCSLTGVNHAVDALLKWYAAQGETTDTDLHKVVRQVVADYATA